MRNLLRDVILLALLAGVLWLVTWLYADLDWWLECWYHRATGGGL